MKMKKIKIMITDPATNNILFPFFLVFKSSLGGGQGGGEGLIIRWKQNLSCVLRDDDDDGDDDLFFELF
jgi:hypothetical protein